MYKVLNIIRKAYWFIFRPKTFGVKALIIKDSQILLVKHSYENLLMLPGGKINRNEKPQDAVAREIKEELSIDLIRPKLFNNYQNTEEFKKDTIYLYTVTEFTGKPLSKSTEIDKFVWANINNLPRNTSKATERRVQEYCGKKTKNDMW